MEGSKFETLREKIKELQDALNQLEAAENPDKALPRIFRREHALKFLENPNSDSLDLAFSWESTPQGEDYWGDIHDSLDDDPPERVPDEAIMQVQRWVITSYVTEFGI